MASKERTRSVIPWEERAVDREVSQDTIYDDETILFGSYEPCNDSLADSASEDMMRSHARCVLVRVRCGNGTTVPPPAVIMALHGTYIL